MNIESFFTGVLFSFAFFFISLFIDFLTDKLLQNRKRMIYIPVDGYATDFVPVWVKSKDYKKIESFYKSEV